MRRNRSCTAVSSPLEVGVLVSGSLPHVESSCGATPRDDTHFIPLLCSLLQILEASRGSQIALRCRRAL